MLRKITAPASCRRWTPTSRAQDAVQWLPVEIQPSFRQAARAPSDDSTTPAFPRRCARRIGVAWTRDHGVARGMSLHGDDRRRAPSRFPLKRSHQDSLALFLCSDGWELNQCLQIVLHITQTTARTRSSRQAFRWEIFRKSTSRFSLLSAMGSYRYVLGFPSHEQHRSWQRHSYWHRRPSRPSA